MANTTTLKVLMDGTRVGWTKQGSFYIQDQYAANAKHFSRVDAAAMANVIIESVAADQLALKTNLGLEEDVIEAMRLHNLAQGDRLDEMAKEKQILLGRLIDSEKLVTAYADEIRDKTSRLAVAQQTIAELKERLVVRPETIEIIEELESLRAYRDLTEAVEIETSPTTTADEEAW